MSQTNRAPDEHLGRNHHRMFAFHLLLHLRFVLLTISSTKPISRQYNTRSTWTFPDVTNLQDHPRSQLPRTRANRRSQCVANSASAASQTRMRTRGGALWRSEHNGAIVQLIQVQSIKETRRLSDNQIERDRVKKEACMMIHHVLTLDCSIMTHSTIRCKLCL
jgi:hypothetical protein